MTPMTKIMSRHESLELSLRPSRGEGSPSARAADFRSLVTDVRARVDARLEEWLRPRVAAAGRVSEEAGLAAEALRDLTLRGGKRMRAALVAAGFEALSRGPRLPGERSWSACEPAMLAVELLQSYLLIQDDWMDGDELRRGGPAVHALLGEQLGARPLGDAAAVLASDLASAYAQEALLACEVAPEHLLRAARVFARVQVDVVTGQLAEMRAELRSAPPARARPSVEAIYALKTASYTVTGPLLLGAALAGAGDAAAAELERFGRPLGVAFQLRDDLLGVFGDPAATGKPVWNDLRQGKGTSLVAELRRDPEGATLLARVHGRADAEPRDLEAVMRRMEASGARGRVEARLGELCDEARRALDAMAPSMTRAGRDWLTGAIAALGERSA